MRPNRKYDAAVLTAIERPGFRAEMKTKSAPVKKPRKVKHRARVPMVSYPVPEGEAVRKMAKEAFTGHFFDDYLSALLGRASAAVAAEFNADIQQRGMPVLDWRVLATLSDSNGMTVSDLAEITLTKQPTLTRLIQRLERKGFVRKAADASDGRLVRLSLTPRGKAEVSNLVHLAKERQKRILAGIDAEPLKASLRYLIAFCAARRKNQRTGP